MTILQVSLPDSVRKFVEAEVTEGGFETPSDYVQSLICSAQKQKEAQKLEAALLEGLKSGDPIEVTKDYWQAKRSQLDTRRPMVQDM